MDGLLGASERVQAFVVVHKKRFVQYHFFPNQVVLKVTTNHIERIWVEMRKDLRGVKKEEAEGRLREVPNRLFRLWSARFEDNEQALIEVICSYVLYDRLTKTGSPFRRVVQMHGQFNRILCVK